MSIWPMEYNLERSFEIDGDTHCLTNEEWEQNIMVSTGQTLSEFLSSIDDVTAKYYEDMVVTIKSMPITKKSRRVA